MYDHIRITYSDATPKAVLQLFADALDRLRKTRRDLRDSDLPTIIQR